MKRRYRGTAIRWGFLILCLAGLSCISCTREGGGIEDLKLDESVYGFHLGERKDGLFERARYRTSWEEIPGLRHDDRGELYRFAKPLDGSRDVDHVRLAFLDGYLMEVIVYFRNTGVSHLRKLKSKLEERYGSRLSSPDGTIETAYKTYRLSTAGMSITLRRITKKPRTELYIQYLHDGLHRRLLQIQEEMSGG
ncbi:MAG: hypothetical protein JSV33_04800 [bacterium]|nr:MAG: hypothetical protein JSV33_04800 [bacterium]